MLDAFAVAPPTPRSDQEAQGLRDGDGLGNVARLAGDRVAAHGFAFRAGGQYMSIEDVGKGVLSGDE